MSIEDNLQVAGQLLQKIAAGESPEAIGALFSADLAWHIPGDPAALPWLGRKHGRTAAEEFVRDSSQLIERTSFAVHDVLASEQRAVIVGELKANVPATGKIIETPFTIVLRIAGGEITEFLMLEDSLAVSAATRA